MTPDIVTVSFGNVFPLGKINDAIFRLFAYVI